MLATNTAIQYFVLGILQQTLFVTLRTHLHHHHHWDPRKSSALDNGGDQRSRRDVQSRYLGSDGSKASIWTGGLDHVARGWKLITALSKRRIRRGIQGDKQKRDRKKGRKDRSSHPAYQRHPGNLNSQGNHQDHRNRSKYCH